MLGVVVVAAGSGTRLGEPVPKAFVTLGDRSLLEHAVRTARSLTEEVELVAVVPAERQDEARRLLADSDAVVVAGGSTRQQSVAAGLAALSPDVDVVLVHDAARPLVPVDVFARVTGAVRRTRGGVIPVLGVVDSVKRIAPRDDAAASLETAVLGAVDRRELVSAQTPQGFPRAALDAAYATAATEHSDDAALFAAAGGAVSTVAGHDHGFKVTSPADLDRAQGIVRGSSARTGVGVDIHAFDETVPLWLGGLHWPDEPGLAGHSDGDALLHAVCDALLSAAGLGDVGSNFGIDDPHYKGAASVDFLQASLERVRAAGYRVANVSVQLVAERPRIAPRRGELEEHLSRLVDAPVSVSGTTADGIGVIGRGEGIQAVAVATLVAA